MEDYLPIEQLAKKQRTFQAELEKVLHEQFKKYTDDQLRNVLDADGKCVIDRITDAKRRKEAGENVAIGKKFYRDMRKEFFNEKEAAEEFPAPPADNTLDDSLFAVLKKVIQHNRDLIPCQNFIEKAEAFNQLNLQSLLTVALKITPGGKEQEGTLFMTSVMVFVVRKSHQVSQKASVDLMNDHFD